MTVELPGWYSPITNELTSSLPRGNMGEVSGRGLLGLYILWRVSPMFPSYFCMLLVCIGCCTCSGFSIDDLFQWVLMYLGLLCQLCIIFWLPIFSGSYFSFPDLRRCHAFFLRIILNILFLPPMHLPTGSFETSFSSFFVVHSFWCHWSCINLICCVPSFFFVKHSHLNKNCGII